MMTVCCSHRNRVLPVVFLLVVVLSFMKESTKELRLFVNDALAMLQKPPPQQLLVDPSATLRSRWRQESICNTTVNLDNVYDQVWAKLCQGDFLFRADTILQHQNIARVVQIGAHVGFEVNDPLANGILAYLEMLSVEERQRFQWTFVEPSTANYKSLQLNLQNHSHYADLRSIQAGVVADSTNSTANMTFHSIRDTIDPVTGFDSRSNKTFPSWITQISSFSMAPIQFNWRVWNRLGLRMDDYVVKTNVTTQRYSDLLRDILDGDDPATSLALVLIDTEGFDCHIVNGIAPDSLYLPQFLVFEDKQCQRGDKAAAIAHLQSMGYVIHPVHENIVAYRQPQNATVTNGTTSSV